MNQGWQQDAARLGGPALVLLLSELRDGQLDVVASVEALTAKVSQHEVATGHLMAAFPASDVDGHRRYHQSVIEWRETRSKLVRSALEKAIGAGVLAGTGWILLAMWQALKLTVKQ